MSATQTTDAPSTPAAPAAAAPGTPEPAPGAPAAPAAEAPAPAAPASPGKDRDAAAPVSAAEAAFRRAKAARAAKESSVPAPEQAAAAPAAGASTPTPAGPDADTSPPAATSGEPGTPPAPDSTATAPEAWPADYREQFDKLPDDARPLVLDFYKDMQAGFTKAMQKVAQHEKGLGDVTKAMQTHGVDASYVAQLMDTAVAFNSDPKTTLQKLAAEAGVPIYFEPPAAPGEIPKFETAEEMAKWVAEQARREAQGLIESERKQAEEKSRAAQSEAEFRAELKAAEALPDWGKLRPAVLERLGANPALSVEDAYRLTTWQALQQQAAEGHAAKQELAALKAKTEAEAKRATQLAQGSGAGKPAIDDSTLTPGQRAYRRAQAKVAARQAGVRA